MFTGASFQQLTTARTEDYNDTPATLALHDSTRCTDGCATHPVPDWARVFLRAAACFAELTPTADRWLLACPGDRPLLLRLAEQAKLRPPQPPAGQRTGPRSRTEWDWRERKEAGRYDAILAAYHASRQPPAPGD
ncbi:hypothetical protein ACFY04_43355 [Streptomyces sp. NPDC001549]|uniref:hypothetical protein n=1 Tax=Streptomyces sp. NPDC001549 TaxID=3364586 RepID=UPI0036B1B4CC